MPGTLFIVATPIGNLEDFSFRGVRTLREVDRIAAEDTRRTAKLLAHYDIQKPLVSLREHNEFRESSRLVDRMLSGESIALVSDAGTPGIADPGVQLVAAARAAGVRVVPIPGASAVAAALSASGLKADQFLFLGFPPSSGQARERWMETLAASPWTTVIYESPHRIQRTLDEIIDMLVNRTIIIGRELTKINEELVEWNNNSAISDVGEFVVLIGPPVAPEYNDPDAIDMATMLGRIAESTGLSDDEALTMVASHFRISTVKARRLLKKGRIALKRAADNQEPT